MCVCVRKQCPSNKLYTTENQWRGDSHEAAAQKWNRSAPSRDRWHLIFLSASLELLGGGKKKIQNRLRAATWRSSELKQTKHSFTFINTKLKEQREGWLSSQGCHGCAAVYRRDDDTKVHC